MEKIRSKFNDKLQRARSINDLRDVRNDFLGKSGLVSVLLRNIKNSSVEERREINAIKNEVENQLREAEELMKMDAIKQSLQQEGMDATLPPRNVAVGLIHPLTKVIRELEDVFHNMGFSMTQGVEIEDDWHNFEALNMPKNHPARQMQDSFFLSDNYVLRTQCTATDIREMRRKKPPYKFISIGKTYRREMDATHSPMFDQVDLQYIDKGITMAHLKYTIMEFCRRFFEVKEINIRFRPSFFPFTTPSLEVDMSCVKENGKIVKFGEGHDWCELGGSGFTHPNVVANVGLNPEEWRGFAFGFGIERMAMLKYGISDVRSLFDGDLRFLKHYSFRFFE